MKLNEAFIGRRKELATLEAAYASSVSAFVPIYGRRRVGKSELILHFSTSHPTIYFLGKKAPAEQQIREFLEVAAQTLREPLLATFPTTTWKKAIDAVFDRWKERRKLVLVFDEFQWMVEKSPELPSVLQELWDRSWQKSGNVLLILCGSYIGFMEREVLGKKSPLYGRRTGQILLKPFGFQEAAQFHPSYSITQQAMTYFICGGIPLYLRFFSEKRSLTQNIEIVLLDENAPLYREPDFLLREELREIEKYYAILMTLAAGSQPSRDIAKETHIADRSLHYYLNSLVDLGYLGRRYPMDGKMPIHRHVRYTLMDPLLRFWFRFIYPHTSILSQSGPHRTMTQWIQPSLETYFGLCFEHLCREALPLIYEKEKVSAGYQIGEYWSKQVQIDIVGFRQDGWTDIGECKWGRIQSIVALEKELLTKLSHYPNPRKATLSPRLFVRERPRRLKESAIPIHTLEDLYSA